MKQAGNTVVQGKCHDLKLGGWLRNWEGLTPYRKGGKVEINDFSL